MSKQAFEGSEETVAAKVEVKKPQNRSIFDGQTKKQPDKVQQEEFKQQASEVNTRLNTYNERAVEVVGDYMKLLNDQTIDKNKSVFASQVEQEVIAKFQSLALDMEADPVQPNGMGSVGVITFLLKVILIQRDKINQLDYNLNYLEKKVKEIIATNVDKQSQAK